MADFGFVGTSYTAPSIYQDDQECINFFAEIDPTKQPGERGIVALYPTPGLQLQTQLAQAEVRGLHTMSGEQIPFFTFTLLTRIYAFSNVTFVSKFVVKEIVFCKAMIIPY